ncbi:hypothetical protein CPB83DRAFT_112524 [Crepidotus variabilis]|uniref:Uncharacterized protein n=1 Tax=Crepidotus variabilis TaxID=179855 RepID=A0A9P6E4N3_9AGAR|nr:hypothetical protein CPB83DRAFT_112524 [Crepidotus variabilis]
MTRYDLLVLDTVETSEYMKGELSDDDLDIPPHLIPPNPDESDMLPSQVHPSYPYGNPNNIKHPSAKPRHTLGTSSRALFEDMGYGGGGTNGTLRWTDLALQDLLPVDAEKEEAQRAIQARKMASGTSNNNPQAPQAQAIPEPLNDDEDEEGEDDVVEEEEDEDTGMYEGDGDEEDLDEDET